MVWTIAVAHSVWNRNRRYADWLGQALSISLHSLRAVPIDISNSVTRKHPTLVGG